MSNMPTYEKEKENNNIGEGIKCQHCSNRHGLHKIMKKIIIYVILVE